MTDPLAGMTREEARELTSNVRDRDAMPIHWTDKQWEQFKALAALGAECVGAREGCIRTTNDVLDSGGSVVLSWSPLTSANSVVIVRRILVLKEDK